MKKILVAGAGVFNRQASWLGTFNFIQKVDEESLFQNK
jgi:hypothetical protein